MFVASISGVSYGACGFTNGAACGFPALAWVYTTEKLCGLKDVFGCGVVLLSNMLPYRMPLAALYPYHSGGNGFPSRKYPRQKRVGLWRISFGE